MSDPVNRALTPPREAEARKASKAEREYILRKGSWKARAVHLRSHDDYVQWEWGRWAYQGYHEFKLSYDEMAAIARKRRQTLYNRAAVHRAWPEAERVYQSLTWSHYEATYSLPKDIRRSVMEQAQAARPQWTVDELREVVRKLRRKLDGKEDEPLPQSFTGTGTAYLQDTNRIIIELNAEELKWPDWSFNEVEVEVNDTEAEMSEWFDALLERVREEEREREAYEYQCYLKACEEKEIEEYWQEQDYLRYMTAMEDGSSYGEGAL